MPTALKAPRRRSARTVAGVVALALPLLAALSTAVAPAGAATPGRLAGAVAPTFAARPGVVVGPVGDYAADVAVRPGGSRALVVSSGYLAQLDVSKDRPTVIGRNQAVRGTDVAYHPSGSTAYVLDDDQLVVVDVSGTTPKPVRALPRVTPSDANAIAVSRDGRWAYVAFGGSFGFASGVKVISLANPRQPVVKATIATDPVPLDVDVSADGKRLVTAHALDDTVGLFDVSTPTRAKPVVRRFRVPFSTVATTFSPNGATVYLWGDDEAKVATLDWQKRLVTRTRSLGSAEGGPDVVVSPDGRYLSAVSNQDSDSTGAVIVDTQSLALVKTFSGLDYSRGLASSPGGPSNGRTFYLSSGSNIFDTPSSVYPVLRS